MKTMICIALDMSGSMSGRQLDVIGGVNNFITEQKKLPGDASLALVRFDSSGYNANIERFRPMAPLAWAAQLTTVDYTPRGGTPLIEAIGKTLQALDEDWKREQPERAIFVIVTDGQNTDKSEFSKAQIKEMIQAREASGKWAIIYLGANVDAFSEASSIGVSMSNSAGYTASARGMSMAFASASASVSEKRFTGDMLAETVLNSVNLGEGNASVPFQAAPTPPPAAVAPVVTTATLVPGVWQIPTSSPPSTWTPPA